MQQIAYINGEFIPAGQAKISIFDRGFLFGDAIYEVIPVFSGKAHFLKLHMIRLANGLASSRIPSPDIDWEAMFAELISLNGGGDLQIYLQISRGNEGVRKHNIPAELSPTVIAFTMHNPFPTFVDKIRGIHAKLVEDIRWQRCDIKTTSLIANILLHDEAITSGAEIALLIRDGFVTEGSTCNVFIVDHEGIICTPPKDNHCLPGVVRQITLDLLATQAIKVVEEKIPVDALFKAKEVWITNTTKGIYPVIRINETTIGHGQGGQYWQRVDKLYQQLITDNNEKK